jgi:L-lactate dehydrogenase (cytochrome)
LNTRGADLCLLGRAYHYGLAAAGEAGVRWPIELLIGQLRRTMQPCGVSTLPDLRNYADEIVPALPAITAQRPAAGASAGPADGREG